MVVQRIARRWAAAGLLAGLWASGTAFAQTPTTTSPATPRLDAVAQPGAAPLFPRVSSWFSTSADTAPAAGQPVAQPAANAPGIVVPDGLPQADGHGHWGGGGHDSDYWKGIPPVQPYPRPGYFVVAPTGEGYYSLLDVVQGNYRQAPPKWPYPRTSINPYTFFDANFSYLDDPDNQDHDWADCLKRIKLFDDTVMFSTGGEFRIRQMNEINARLTGKDNNYQLMRERIYADLWITNRFRIFAEFIDANTFNENLPPLVIDRNKTDMQNLFIDVRTLEIADSPIWVRVGRQEMLYGSQRLISPLDWANTRRTFQGAKAFWSNEDFSFDVFSVQPVFPDPRKFDSPDNRMIFSGAWGTYRPEKGQAIDLYYLNLNRERDVTVANSGVGPRGNIDTIGARYAGASCNNFLWDVEGMFQFGTIGNQDLCAGSVSVYAGYNFKDVALKPQIWVGYDYATGSNNPHSPFGGNNTFQQLFPFGHYYFGFIDDVGRQNIQDFASQLTVFPTDWIQAQIQNHVFYLANSRDALYNAGGTPIRFDPTGRAGNYVGDEIDLTINFHLSNHQDILIGYSHLFAGGFIEHAPTVAAAPKGSTAASRAQDPELFYVQYSFKW
jgi:hypothetical protein